MNMIIILESFNLVNISGKNIILSHINIQLIASEMGEGATRGLSFSSLFTLSVYLTHHRRAHAPIAESAKLCT